MTIPSEIAATLARVVAGKGTDDFPFVTPTGLPLHNADFYERIWTPLMKKLPEAGVAPFGFHDLRHTHVAWLVVDGAPLPEIQAKRGEKL